MLDQLIHLTNSSAFVDRGDLRIVEVRSRPGESADVFLTLEVGIEDEFTFEETVQVWQVRCLDTAYSFGNSLRDYKHPYNQLRVYTDHPVLLNYQHHVEIELRGQCTNVPELLGSLYEVHGEACGHWVNFSWHFAHLAGQLRERQQADLGMPARLLQAYAPVFQHYGLAHTVVGSETSAWLKPPLCVLLFSNPAVCPDTFNLSQPYQVAQRFEEQRLA